MSTPELTDLAKLTALAIEQDQGSTHAVEIVNGSLSLTAGVGRDISAAMQRINQRAMKANMVILSTTISTNTYVLPTAQPYLVVTVLCQWVERSELESVQRQQMLAGGQGPRGVN